MKYLIVATATDSDGTDVYLFNGSEKEMQDRVKAKCLDFLDYVQQECEYLSFGYDKYQYPVYQGCLCFDDYHFLVQGFKWEDVRKKVSVSRKNLYKAKKLNEDGFIENLYKDEDD